MASQNDFVFSNSGTPPSGKQVVNVEGTGANPTAIDWYTNNAGGVNLVVGVSYTVLNTDLGKLLIFNNASAVAVTLPIASSFDAHFLFAAANLGAGSVTVTPTTSTIDGVASKVLTTGQGLAIFSDGTNYYTNPGMTGGGGGTPSGTGLVRVTSGAYDTRAELSGDVTTAGALATTVAKIQGTTVTGTTGTGKVVLDSAPALTGVPTAPTATVGTNTTQIATTAFVLANAGAGTVTHTGNLDAHKVVVGNGTADEKVIASTGTAGQLLRSGGSSADPAFADQISEIGFQVDGSGALPGTGNKRYIQVDFDCTIVEATVVADVGSSSATFTVKKCTNAAFPTTASIVASAPPTLTNAQKSSDTSLTGWTVTITAGDWLEFTLATVSTLTWVQLILKVKRT